MPMTYAKIPEKDAVLLVRALGLLVSQAGVYGPSHKVTQSAARSVYAELSQVISTYGPVEITLNEKELLVNGSCDGIGSVAGKNLMDRMALHKIGGIAFLSPLDLNEFLTCVILFGTQPFALTAEGGFDGALKKANLHSVRVVTVAFQRVEEGAKLVLKDPALEKEKQPEAPPAARRSAAALASGVLDLSAALSGVEDDPGMEEQSGANHGRHDPASLTHQKRSSELAALLREAATLLESGAGHSAQELPSTVVDALSQIRNILSEMAVGSEHEISALASQVNEDRQTIASIESAARRRGIGLKLMRAELVQRYAELNQEIMQPLTVSTGVIDMLSSGCTGPLTDAQHELLKMAAESVDRVNQLVAYMKRISGLPETYTPDEDIIRDSYR